MTEKWCQEQLAKLEIADLRETTLQEILKEINQPQTTFTFSANFLKSPAMFDCLDQSKDQVTVACDILEICMSHLEIGDSVNNYSNLLERALHHPNPDVKSLAIKELCRVVRHCPTVNLGVNLILELIKCIDESVGAAVIPVLSQSMAVFLDNQSVRASLEHTLTSNSVTRCRTYEIALNIVLTAPDGLKEINMKKVHFILEQLFIDLDSNDVLLQLNALELLSNLAADNIGIKYLLDNDVVQRIAQDMEKLDTNPLATILTPGYLKFFGAICQTRVDVVFRLFSYSINMLMECFTEIHLPLLPVAFDTFGQLCSTLEGKLSIEQLADQHQVMSKISRIIRHVGVDIKVRALRFLERLFANYETVDNRVVYVLEKFYKQLSDDQMNLHFIADHVKNPFAEIKNAALEVLFNVIQYNWGHEYFVHTGGLAELLLDRNDYCDTEAKHAKYKIIKCLAQSSAFDDVTSSLLKQYVTDGPFYVQGLMEVAVENIS